MAYTNSASMTYQADDLARVIDLPEMFRGQTLTLIGPGAHISRDGIVYYPFQSDEEVLEWIDAETAEWWNNETV